MNPTKKGHLAKLLWLSFGDVYNYATLTTQAGENHRVGACSVAPSTFALWESKGWVKRDAAPGTGGPRSGSMKVRVTLTSEGRKVADSWGDIV